MRKRRRTAALAVKEAWHDEMSPYVCVCVLTMAIFLSFPTETTTTTPHIEEIFSLEETAPMCIEIVVEATVVVVASSSGCNFIFL